MLDSQGQVKPQDSWNSAPVASARGPCSACSSLSLWLWDLNQYLFANYRYCHFLLWEALMIDLEWVERD